MNRDRPIHHHDIEKLNDALTRQNLACLFIVKGAAVLHGFPDTTPDINILPRKDPENARALIAALIRLGFAVDAETADQITLGKDFAQLRNGPIDVDLVFAPDGIEDFDDGWSRGVRIEGFPVCALDDIIESERRANRARDREALPRLEKFRAWTKLHARSNQQQPLGTQPGSQASLSQSRKPREHEWESYREDLR